MASLKKGNILLDHITGNLGGLVFRQRNGKTIVSKKPTCVSLSKKPACIAARNKFRTGAKFALFLSKLPHIAEVWKAANVEGQYSFHKLLKYNAKFVSQFLPTGHNIITPAGYSMKIQDVILYEDNIKVVLEGNDESENDKLLLIIVLHNKVTPDAEDFLLIDLTPQNNSDIVIRATDMRHYTRFIIYCAVSRQTGSELTWSNTHTIEGDFEVYDN